MHKSFDLVINIQYQIYSSFKIELDHNVALGGTSQAMENLDIFSRAP